MTVLAWGTELRFDRDEQMDTMRVIALLKWRESLEVAAQPPRFFAANGREIAELPAWCVGTRIRSNWSPCNGLRWHVRCRAAE